MIQHNVGLYYCIALREDMQESIVQIILKDVLHIPCLILQIYLIRKKFTNNILYD